MRFAIFGLLFILHLSYAQKAYEEKAGDSDWTTKHQAYLKQTADNKANIKAVFLGDSITEGWNWGEWGLEIWNVAYKPRGAFNYGIGGDNTQGVLYRIHHGEFDGLTPKVVVLNIGTNNIGFFPDADTAQAIQTIVKDLRTKMPKAKIILMGIFPRQGDFQDSAVDTINAAIKSTANVTYIDLGSKLRASHGNVVAADYRDDQLHINANGYKIWHDGIETQFAAALAAAL